MNFKFTDLEKYFPIVQKPARYLGNELNIINKDISRIKLHVALAFPDVYEIGMSYTGFKILYNMINNNMNYFAERVFMPWPDMISVLENTKYPLFSLETKTPIKNFDVLGFTLQYELNYSNIVWMLHLGGLPLSSKDRDKDYPLVIGGGIGAFNPEPVADFFDILWIGDAEHLFSELLEKIVEYKNKDISKQDFLESIKNNDGVYIPSLYEAKYSGKSFVSLVDKKSGDIPNPIKKVALTSFEKEHLYNSEILPLIDITHNRVAVEIMRGCSHGCRFCNAGFLYRPIREKDPSLVYQEAINKLERTGWNELGLLSLASSDYTMLESILDSLLRYSLKKHISFSIPSSRIDEINDELLFKLQGERKTGLTFAPEAGTQRLRNIINKDITDEQIYKVVEKVYKAGWNVVKLYFMIGLPFEEESDIIGIAEMINKVLNIAKFYGKNKKLNVTISPFIPKPHTPFQWARQSDIEEIDQKIQLLKSHINFSKNLKLSYRDSEVTIIEGIFARGDRKLSKVLSKVIDKRIFFDGWTDYFSFDKWMELFNEFDIDYREYLKPIDINAVLPWEHIDTLVSKDFLVEEYRKAEKGIVTPDCRYNCSGCGVCSSKLKNIVYAKKKKIEYKPIKYGRRRVINKKSGIVSKQKYRMQFTKYGDSRFIGHLDIFRLLDRIFRKVEFPVSYSQGYNPHPKIALGPPLGVGISSKVEYMDIQTDFPITSHDINKLNVYFPDGFKIIKSKIIYNKTPSLSASINVADYIIFFNHLTFLSFFEEKYKDTIEYYNSLFNNKDELYNYLLYLINEWNSRDNIIEREKKDGAFKELNLNSMVESIEVLNSNPLPYLKVRLLMSQSGNAKIEEVLNTLLKLPSYVLSQFYIERVGLYIRKGNILKTPLEVI